MILVFGGIGSGKREYVRSLGYSQDCLSGRLDEQAPVLTDAQELVRDQVDEEDVAALAESIALRKSVVILVDVGSGIVPLEQAERSWRDRVGLLSRELASRAEAVVRMMCGIPMVIKGQEPSAIAEPDVPAIPVASDAIAGEPGANGGAIEIVIMRHGTSTYNEQRRYAGWTDVPLSEKGRQEALAAGVCPQVGKVYVSPLLRARQTAEICFPNAQQVVVDGLQEMNFGDFEGRTAAEMEDDPAYRTWVDGMCTARCPNGEGQDDMIGRMDAAIRSIVCRAQDGGERRVIVVAHGGTIMAALTGVSGDGSDYFGWQVGNCEGYRALVSCDGSSLRYSHKERFHNLDFLREHAGDAQDPQDPQDAPELPERPSWQEPHAFFQNRACRYFPCHEGVSIDEFNCLFCYCPLYALGPDCGGNYSYTEKGRKNCTGCALPHLRDCGAKMVASHYEALATLARQEGDVPTGDASA